MGNAYDNASLIITPNAYKASKIYALKPTDGSGDLSFSRAGSKMVRNSSGLWETIGTNIPPLHYPVGGGCPSWLFEAEATCLIPNSNTFTGDCTKTTGITDSPISGVTSVRITKTSASAEYVVSSYSATIANSTPYAPSLFFKYDGHDIDSSLEFNNGGDWGLAWKANVEIRSTGITVVLQQDCTAVLVAEANGWYRLEVSLTTATVTNNSGSILIKASGANAATFLITTSNLTQETNPSSPILTSAGNVTRLRDVPTGTMIAGTLGYTIVTNVNSLTNTAAIRNFLDFSNGSGRQGILAKSAANKLIFQVYLNGTLVNTLTSTNDLPSGMGKCAVVFNGTIYKIFMDGGVEGTLAAVGGFPNAYGFNDAASSIEQKDLEYYNVALSDSEIVDLITA